MAMSDVETSPAAYGIETEYSCMLTLPGEVVHEIVGRCHSVDVPLNLYQQPRNKGFASIKREHMEEALGSLGIYRTPSGMLSNGGRLYIDPSGPEYDTPERATAEEAVHSTFDGDDIMLGMLDSMRQSDIIEGCQANRRIVDHNRTSRGIHLNTTTTLQRQPGLNTITKLATLNAAKGAIFGSGGLLVDKEGNTAFHHSPRLSLTNKMSAPYVNYRERPLVRLPFKPDGDLGRIETVTSDALNFAWPLRASLVLTNAVTTLIEMGYGSELPRIRRPERAARRIGRHGNDTWVRLHDDESDNGDKEVRPLDVIRGMCEAVMVIDGFHQHLDKESVQVVGEIIDVADRMMDDPLSVAPQVESVARQLAMYMKMEQDGIALDSEAMCRFDYAWDWLGGGIAETLRKKGTVGWQGFSQPYAPRATKVRMVTPPNDTRAGVRGRLIKATKGNNGSTWDAIDFGQQSAYIHPLSTELPVPDPNS